MNVIMVNGHECFHFTDMANEDYWLFWLIFDTNNILKAWGHTKTMAFFKSYLKMFPLEKNGIHVFCCIYIFYVFSSNFKEEYLHINFTNKERNNIPLKMMEYKPSFE